MKYLLLAAAFLITFIFGLFLGMTNGGGGKESASAPPRTVTVEKTVQGPERTITVPQQRPESTRASAPTPAPAISDISCKVGQECDLGDSSVTVTSAKQVKTINTSLGDTFEGNFVIVEFDYTYGGSTPADTRVPPFRLSDRAGNVYSLHFKATNAYGIDKDRSLIYTTVQPGVTAPGTAVFEVAPGAKDFTLLVVDLVSPQSNKTAAIPF